MRYASTYPDRLRRLFLLDAPFYLPPSELQGQGTGLKYLYEVGSKWLWDRLATAKQKDRFLYKLASGVAAKPLEEAFHADDIPTHWEIMSKNLENTVNKATFVDDLPKLSMPTVFCVGVRDAIVKVSQTPALKRLKPDLEIRKLTGFAADHMTLWNMPERVAEEIMRDEVRELNVAWRGGSGEPLVLLHGLDPSSGVDPCRRGPRPNARRRRRRPARLRRLARAGQPRTTPSPTTSPRCSAPSARCGGRQPESRFVGEGLGATVALGCAATVPERSAGVVAFSPRLLEPGTLPSTTLASRSLRARSGRAARLWRASSPRASAPVRSRRAGRVRIVADPALGRERDAGTDADALLAQVPAPVTIRRAPRTDSADAHGVPGAVAEAPRGVSSCMS